MKIIVGVQILIRSIFDLAARIKHQWLRVINRQLAIGFCAIAFALSGCVKYDTGVNFSGLNYGEIVEHIQPGEQLNSFSQNAVQTWVTSIENRTKQAEGKLERLNARELLVTIPFNNASELATKIDRYFNPNLASKSEYSDRFKSHLQVAQSNFLVVVRNHLTYDIDLRSLIVKTTDPKVSVAATNFVDLNFSIQSPWGVKSGEGVGDLIGVNNSIDRKINWQLKPGELNHIDAIFWLPNPLGIGAIVIIAISIGGYYLKYRQLPLIPAAK